MKFNPLSMSLGLVATAALSTVIAPQQAAAFSLGSGVSSVGGALTVTQSTTFNFSFLQSRGKFQSSFGIYTAPSSGSLLQTLFAEVIPFDPGSSGNKNDFLGTPGVTVLNPTASVVLGPGTYYFGLATPGVSTGFTQLSGTIASASGLGVTGLISNASSYTFAAGQGKTQTLNFAPGNFFVALNDPGNDKDLQDFLVSFSIASTPKPVPEPSLLLGLGLSAGSLLLARRRMVKA